MIVPRGRARRLTAGPCPATIARPMSRTDDNFATLRAARRTTVIPFLCGGWPRPGGTAAAIRAVARAGARIVEVGIPFSDPVADGPVIAGAMHEALERGATVRGVLAEVAEARAETDAALIAMVSVSIVHRFGVERFVAECAAAGFDGFIFPDLALEEADEAAAVVRAAGRSLSMLIAPATPPERAAALAAASSGFCYLLARAGVTGSGAGAAGKTTGPAGKTAAPAGAGLAERLRGLRRVTDLPIACGFGISTPQQVAAVTAEADAAIVGSAIVGAMRRAAEAGEDPAEAAAQLTGSLLAAAK